MKKKTIIITCAALLGSLGLGFMLWHDLMGSPFELTEPAYVYVRPGTDTDAIVRQLRYNAHATSVRGFTWGARLLGYTPRTGRYVVRPGDSMLTVLRRMRNGHQEPVRLTLPSTRGLNRVAGVLGRKLMLDSAMVANAFADSAFIASTGYTTATFPALFIPDTYEVYWDISLDELMERLERENEAFWQRNGRADSATAIGLTREEVYTLASIVDEETASTAEKPEVAGLYLNRLHIDMPLQADPTVKFAVGDETLRRITGEHLATESPYNTYKHTGLPPGPIRIATQAGIDAVLHATRHTYIYMCAREDFSGRHNFATTFGEHQNNARRYQRALNARGIK